MFFLGRLQDHQDTDLLGSAAEQISVAIDSFESFLSQAALWVVAVFDHFPHLLLVLRRHRAWTCSAKRRRHQWRRLRGGCFHVGSPCLQFQDGMWQIFRENRQVSMICHFWVLWMDNKWFFSITSFIKPISEFGRWNLNDAPAWWGMSAFWWHPCPAIVRFVPLILPHASFKSLDSGWDWVFQHDIAVSWQAGTHSRTANHVEELHRGHSQIALQSFCTVLPLLLEQVSSFCDTLTDVQWLLLAAWVNPRPSINMDPHHDNSLLPSEAYSLHREVFARVRDCLHELANDASLQLWAPTAIHHL